MDFSLTDKHLKYGFLSVFGLFLILGVAANTEAGSFLISNTYSQFFGIDLMNTSMKNVTGITFTDPTVYINNTEASLPATILQGDIDGNGKTVENVTITHGLINHSTIYNSTINSLSTAIEEKDIDPLVTRGYDLKYLSAFPKVLSLGFRNESTDLDNLITLDSSPYSHHCDLLSTIIGKYNSSGGHDGTGSFSWNGSNSGYHVNLIECDYPQYFDNSTPFYVELVLTAEKSDLNGDRTIFAMQNGPTTGVGWHIDIVGSYLRLRKVGGGNAVTDSDIFTNFKSDGLFHHVVIVYHPNTCEISFYLDGTFKGTKTMSAGCPQSMDNPVIKIFNREDTSKSYNGTLSYVNMGLSEPNATEVLAMYKHQMTPENPSVLQSDVRIDNDWLVISDLRGITWKGFEYLNISINGTATNKTQMIFDVPGSDRLILGSAAIDN